jgi:hypothetical protein
VTTPKDRRVDRCYWPCGMARRAKAGERQRKCSFSPGAHSSQGATVAALGHSKRSRASKTSCRRVGPVWVKVDATGLLRRQSSCDWISGVNPLPFISTVRPQSLPEFDQLASTILWRPKCLSRSTHQLLKMLSDIGYARLTFRCRPGAVFAQPLKQSLNVGDARRATCAAKRHPDVGCPCRASC